MPYHVSEFDEKGNIIIVINSWAILKLVSISEEVYIQIPHDIN